MLGVIKSSLQALHMKLHIGRCSLETNVKCLEELLLPTSIFA